MATDTSKYVNTVQFPDTLQGMVDLAPDIVKCNSISSNAINACDAEFVGYRFQGGSASFDGGIGLYVYYKNSNRTDDYKSVVGLYYNFSSNSYSKIYYQSSDTVSVMSFVDYPLYYGVEPSSSVIIAGTMLAIAFFYLIYKMFKRVLF